MQRRKTTVTAALAGLVLTGMVATTAPSFAAGTASPSPDAAHVHTPKGDGAKALCHRVPKLDKRITNRIKKIEAGASTRGSVKFLEQRIANAKKKNHTAVAKLLGDRLTTREALLPGLKQKLPDLKDVSTWCKANNNGKKAAGSPAS
ncbi:hypothetical protein [Streptomyces sp. NBC_00859]|uniref:hypothetical protein n=1 Tax=Streptomyces sp. NBC_00859 TaxID=2903682 RepID=UPI003870354E|nr:hypothetical protein OG584_06985 [Streptomyces sp. NBC_00859]